MVFENSLLLNQDSFYKSCVNLGLITDVTKNPPQHIWIGFSGGMDSRVLLELAYITFAKNPKYKLHAVYINHGVSKDSNSWQEHCRKVCKRLSIDFQAIKLTEQYHNSSNLEAELRLARIKIWQQLLSINDILLLAHNLNDQAETVLLRLCRGAGLTGLTAIKAINYLGKIKIARPLLSYSRQQIEEFANNNQLQHIQDDSNFNKKFARNFVRHDILPALTRYWPAVISNISKAANRLQQANNYISQQISTGLINCCGYDNYHNNIGYRYNNYYVDKKFLLINKLLQYDDFLQTEILRQFIMDKKFYPPSEDQLARIYNEVIYSKIDSQPRLVLGTYIITRYRSRLYVYSKDYLLAKDTGSGQGWSNKLGELTIYFAMPSKVIGPNKVLNKAKKIFQQLGIPAWQRYDYPLVFNKNKLVAILGLWSKGL